MKGLVLKVTVGIATIVASLVWCAEFYRYRNINDMLAYGMQADGVVTYRGEGRCSNGLSSQGKSRYHKCYVIAYEFLDHEGFQHEERTVVSKDTYRSMRVGKPVRVLFSKDDPKNSGMYDSFDRASYGTLFERTYQLPLMFFAAIILLGTAAHFAYENNRKGKP